MGNIHPGAIGCGLGCHAGYGLGSFSFDGAFAQSPGNGIHFWLGVCRLFCCGGRFCKAKSAAPQAAVAEGFRSVVARRQARGQAH